MLIHTKPHADLEATPHRPLINQGSAHAFGIGSMRNRNCHEAKPKQHYGEKSQYALRRFAFRRFPQTGGILGAFRNGMAFHAHNQPV